MTPEQVLKHFFGYSTFRPNQKPIVETIVDGQDVLALLPTGGGKSLCFQVPGLVLGGITLVISPLISLMKDQVDTLSSKGVPAVYLNSSLEIKKQTEVIQLIKLGKINFIYLSPEKLASRHFKKLSKSLPIKLIAIDEAHCIAQWGHDFRPEYLHIAQFISTLPKRPIVAAFTATATSQTQNEIITSLSLKAPKVFSNSFQRDNLFLSVINCHSPFWQEFYLLYLLKKHGDENGIIYTLTREKARTICQLISYHWPHASVAYYHGGLSSEERATIQEKYLSGELRLIVATNAFGMGVDKSNIRFVIHYQIPSNLENYYQEAGRAGRDGQFSNCYLLFNPHDLKISQELIRASENPLSQKQSLQKLQSMYSYAVGRECRNQVILNYFGQKSEQNSCDHCDVCCATSLKPAAPDQHDFDALVALRKKLSEQYQVPKSEILTLKQLHWVTLLKPKKPTDYLKIPGIGKGWMQKWYSSINLTPTP